jgi:hypothetical protein
MSPTYVLYCILHVASRVAEYKKEIKEKEDTSAAQMGEKEETAEFRIQITNNKKDTAAEELRLKNESRKAEAEKRRLARLQMEETTALSFAAKTMPAPESVYTVKQPQMSNSLFARTEKAKSVKQQHEQLHEKKVL